MSTLVIRGGQGPLSGRVRVPGDKSIGHRAILFAALARGRSAITGLSAGEDNMATRRAFAAMGVSFEDDGDIVRVSGVGLRGLSMPQGVVDCGNSGTTMRLLCGALSGQRFGTRLCGDESLSGRPMARVIDPLRARGAFIGGSSRDDKEGVFAPISIAPLVQGEALRGIEYDMPIASAQVKSALLLSGLYANGPTVVREPVLSRDHTERMLVALGVPLSTAGSTVAFDPNDERFQGGWDPFAWTIPGDISSAAFVLAAALARPESDVVIEGVGVNPTRTGFLDLLRMMGVNAPRVPKGGAAGDEPMADLFLCSDHEARGTLIGGELLVRMIDEVPAACVVAAFAHGRTEIRDAAELRVKESDRIAAMHEVLTAFGVPNTELPDGLVIEGRAPLRPATVKSRGDHRIAMSAAVLALAAAGESVIEDVDCIATSFPDFVPLLRSLGADIQWVGDAATGTAKEITVAIDGPAGAGKSAAAKRLADAVGYVLVDTGALYRASALCAIERGLDLSDGPAVGALIATLDLSFAPGPRVLIDGRDREDEIRTPIVSEGASLVSQHPEVRAALLGLQRRLGQNGGVVLEGRDIGTVVFPHAEVKVFLTASSVARAQRRVDQLTSRGVDADYATILNAIETRDQRDSTRAVAPLKPAEDATLLDTTGLSLDAVVGQLVNLVNTARGRSGASGD